MDALVEQVDLRPHTKRVSLGELRPGVCGVVAAIETAGTSSESLVRRLMELGFVRGEAVQVIAEARPGGDPFVVRIGETALAMRREEARPIHVELSPEDAL